MGTTLDGGIACDGSPLSHGRNRRCDRTATYSLTVPHARTVWVVCVAHLDRLATRLHATYGVEPTIRRIPEAPRTHG